MGPQGVERPTGRVSATSSARSAGSDHDRFARSRVRECRDADRKSDCILMDRQHSCANSPTIRAECVHRAKNMRRDTDLLDRRRTTAARRAATILRKWRRPYRMLYDLTAIDERNAQPSRGTRRRPISPWSIISSPSSGTTDIRIKVPLKENALERAHHCRSLAQRQLVRARSMGYVRHSLCRPPASEPHPYSADTGAATRSQRPLRPGHRDGPLRAYRGARRSRSKRR